MSSLDVNESSSLFTSCIPLADGAKVSFLLLFHCLCLICFPWKTMWLCVIFPILLVGSYAKPLLMGGGGFWTHLIDQIPYSVMHQTCAMWDCDVSRTQTQWGTISQSLERCEDLLAKMEVSVSCFLCSQNTDLPTYLSYFRVAEYPQRQVSKCV